MAGDAVHLFRNRDKKSFVDTLNQLLKDESKLKEAKRDAFLIAEDMFCWEKQEQNLVNWVSKVI
jgi:hypothetical protein